jgi:hypothetical protein
MPEGIDRMLDYVGNAYQEGFSDLCSVLLLGSEKVDYYSVFRKGGWQKNDIDATKSVFRISGVVQACFSEEASNSLTGDAEFDEFMERLCANAREHEYILAPLVEYLQSCKETFVLSLARTEKLDMIRQLYQKARNGLDDGALDMLLQKWMVAAQENYD